MSSISSSGISEVFEGFMEEMWVNSWIGGGNVGTRRAAARLQDLQDAGA